MAGKSISGTRFVCPLSWSTAQNFIIQGNARGAEWCQLIGSPQKIMDLFQRKPLQLLWHVEKVSRSTGLWVNRVTLIWAELFLKRNDFALWQVRELWRVLEFGTGLTWCASFKHCFLEGDPSSGSFPVWWVLTGLNCVMCPIYCCSFCFQIWPDFCSALKRCIKSIICTRLVRNPLLPLPNKLHYCLLGQERANLALFKAKLAVDFKSQELSYIRRRVWFLTPQEKLRAVSFEVSERKIVTNFDPSPASCLQSALDRQWDLKWEVIWTVWCRVVTVWFQSLGSIY